MYTHKTLIRIIRSLGEKIDAPEELLCDFKKNQCAQPYIEIKFPFYYLTISENGRILETQKFHSTDMLLFAVFEKITFEMALRYELTHRIPAQDCRRVLFSVQLNLMEKLSIKWKELLQSQIEEILEQYPYQDAEM